MEKTDENIDILALNMCPILLGAIHNCTIYVSKSKGLPEEERKKAMIDILEQTKVRISDASSKELKDDSDDPLYKRPYLIS